MTEDKLYIEGELFLKLEVVAELYQVKSVWLREVYDSGLIGRERAPTTELCIAAVEMDRVATIVRLHRVLGLELDAIALALDEP